MTSLSHGKNLDTTGFGLTRDDLKPVDPANDRFDIDPRSWFPHAERPFELEIGSGKGTFLVQQAPLKDDTNFLGIEWAKPFWAYAADRARRHALDNVRLLHADASEFVHFRCAGAVADVVHLYFSDPWPKSRHHKRRVLQDRSILDFHRILRDGGELRLVTDHDELWAWYEEHAARHTDRFERRPFAPPAGAKAGELVGTNYERKFTREGRPFHAMVLHRI